MGHFKHSTKASTDLKRTQQEMNTPQHQLIQDVRVRWNSTHDMAERLLEQKWTVSKVLDESNNQDLNISAKDWKVMESLVHVLGPFKTATTKLSGQNYPTLSLLYPELKKLRKAVEPEVKDTEIIKIMKKKMTQKLDAKFGKQDSPTVTDAMIATGLDPRYKSLKCLLPDLREKVKEEIVLLVKKEIDDQKQQESPPPKRMRPSQSSEESSSDDDITLHQSTTHFQAAQEYEGYVREKKREKCESCPADNCALQWWKAMASRYPHVGSVARKYLGIPATSTASERSFSAAGNIVTNKRANLSSEHVDALVSLAMNRHM